MSLKNKYKCLHVDVHSCVPNITHTYESKCVLTDRVVPFSISPIDYARGNGSSNIFTCEPLQITKVKISSIKCITPKESTIFKTIPTIKLK